MSTREAIVARDDEGDRNSRGEPGAHHDEVMRFEDVSRTFTGFAAVDCISLSLRKGEILTLLGPSGCGKTTTLRMAIGLERCTSGQIHFRDRLVDAPGSRVFVPPEARNMGIVFQSYAVWPHMTVFENVAFPLRMRKLPKHTIAEKVADALRLVGLSQFASRLGTQLSGGQQQRVAIARGLVFNPNVLLLDEPFSNLDAQLRDQMRSEVKELQRSLDISILFVTHDQTEALALSDRLAVMKAGRIEQIGPPGEIYFEPATPFVRDFMGQWIKLPAKSEARSGDRIGLRFESGAKLAVPAGSIAPASDVVVSVRPEHVEVEPAPAGGGSDDIAGTMRALLFLGPVYEAHIRLSTGQDIVVNVPSNRAWETGQEVVLRLDPDRLKVWPASGEGAQAQ